MATPPCGFMIGRMLTLSQSLSFLLVAILITASPGPDNLMVLGMGMSKGRRQGIAFGLGCALGCLSHTVQYYGEPTLSPEVTGQIFGCAITVHGDVAACSLHERNEAEKKQ